MNLNECTSAEVLENLSKNNSDAIKKEVASNVFSNEQTLEYLSKDKSYYIRGEVAKNKNTPLKVLIKLSKDRAVFVRKEVAKSTNDLNILKKLAKDKNNYVAELVIINSNANNEILESFVTHKNKWCRAKLASMNAPAYILHQLTDDTEATVLVRLSANVFSSAETLEKLYLMNVKFYKKTIMRNIVRNSSTPLELLIKLIKSRDLYTLDFLMEELNYRSQPVVTPRHIIQTIKYMIAYLT